MVATGALRRAEPGERHLKGLTVAVNPERYPNPYGLLRPQIADEFDAPVSEDGKELPNGWRISASTSFPVNEDNYH